MYKVMTLKEIYCSNKKKEKIVENLNIHLNSEEIVEIYGGINSGKTVLLEIMHGIVKPDRGVIDKNCKTAMVFKDIIIYQDMSVEENFEFFGEISLSDVKKREMLIETLGLGKFRKRRVGTLPEGLKRVTQIGCAIQGEFNLVLMDEPLLALDNCYQKIVEDKMKELKKNGKTVVYTTGNSNLTSYYDRKISLNKR